MKKLLTILLLGFVVFSNAQQLPQYSLYMLNDGLVNPSSLCSKSDNQIILMVRDQWTGFKGAPKTQSISYYNLNHPKYKRGINLINDVTGPISILNASLTGSYTVPINDKNNFAIGATASIQQYKIDYTKIDLYGNYDLDDPAYQGGVEKALGHSVNLGAYYYNSDFFVGFSVPNLIGSNLDISSDKENNKLENHYYLNGGLSFDVGANYELIPSIMFKKIGAAPVQMDLNIRTIYGDFFWGGLSYRTKDAFVVLLGLDYSSYSFGYSYDITTSNMRIPSAGSHGLLVAYKFKVIEKDTDKDGIPDFNDDCPKIKGKKELNGCPDNDDDGIKNSKDDCPDEWGLKINNGCPDTDGDGVIDKRDHCKETPGIAELLGCPDSDGDGIQDAFDDCPDEWGPAISRGCPQIPGQDTVFITDTIVVRDTIYIPIKNNQDLKKAFKNIQFDFDRSTLTSNSKGILDLVFLYLNKKSELRIHLEGHTDNIDSPEFNMWLSKKRVKAVQKYLVDKGIAKKRIKISWKGETQPLLDENSEKARAKNRRVELRILNED